YVRPVLDKPVREPPVIVWVVDVGARNIRLLAFACPPVEQVSCSVECTMHTFNGLKVLVVDVIVKTSLKEHTQFKAPVGEGVVDIGQKPGIGIADDRPVGVIDDVVSIEVPEAYVAWGRIGLRG